MTYHPKQIMFSALFFATKTENSHIPLVDFSSKIPDTTPESILAPEYLLTQGLRFTFDVRHPLRGLEGGFMEMFDIAEGSYSTPSEPESKAKQAQRTMLCLPLPGGEEELQHTPETMKSRIADAHGATKELVRSAALLSDSYFLYTPSQIWLASLLIADEPLGKFYVSLKLPASSPDLSDKIMKTVRDCAELLKRPVLIPTAMSSNERSEIVRIDKKLYFCQNPEKADLVALNKAVKQKRQDGLVNSEERENKKRKVDDDMFGPAL
jgi:cyclin H